MSIKSLAGIAFVAGLTKYFVSFLGSKHSRSIFAPRKRKNGVAGSSFKDIGVEIVGK
jgi:hypothetical protein